MPPRVRLGDVNEPDERPNLATQIDATIGQNLRKARESRGMSQADLARLVTDSGIPGVYQTTIARIESGVRSMRAAEALAVARLLETNLEWLAETGVNALLRTYSGDLANASHAFDAAAKTLIAARARAAIHLDRTLPYGPEGEAPIEDVVALGVEVNILEVLEDDLSRSSPVERLELALRDELGTAQQRDGERMHMILAEYQALIDADQYPGYDDGER